MKPCPLCAELNADGVRFCCSCGADLDQTVSLQPAAPVTEEGTSGKAIGSLVCGIFFFFLPTAVAAVILGHISRSEIRRSAGRLRGSGMALAGLILGYMGSSVIPIMIIAAIAIPNLLRARMAANEASATVSLRVLATACETYKAQYGGYPRALANLGPSDSPSADAAGLIDVTLASGRESGYVFDYSPVKTEGNRIAAPITTYGASADPIVPNSTGTRHFFIDQTMVIRWEMNKSASGESPPLE